MTRQSLCLWNGKHEAAAENSLVYTNKQRVEANILKNQKTQEQLKKTIEDTFVLPWQRRS